MQKPKRRTYIIDLNGPAARGNLRLLALLYPIWGLLMPMYICFTGQPVISVPDFTSFAFFAQKPFLISIYLGLLFFTLSILTNRLVITGKTIRFGHKLFGSHSTAKLKALALNRSPLSNRETIVRFDFGNDRLKQETIETEGMESRMKARLMAALDNLAGQCQTPKAVRTLLMQSTREKTFIKSGETITIPYHSRLLIVQIKEMMALYQQYFWRVWAIIFGVITFALGPVGFCFLLEQLRQTFFASMQSDKGIEGLLNGWVQLWKGAYPLLQNAADTESTINNYAKEVPAATALCLGGLIVLGLLSIYMARPNRLTISKEGLTIWLEYFGMKLTEQFLGWDRLESIALSKAGQTSPADWKLKFTAKEAVDSVQLTLGAIRGNVQRLELVKAIEKYAADIPVDPDALSALAPPDEGSYTELWLSSLASAPQREKLTPLSAGHALKAGDYVIDGRHGAGGQGVTYLAHRSNNNLHEAAPLKQVNEKENDTDDQYADLVIKETILPIYVDSQNRREAVEHFERDAKLLLRLNHHNLVKLRDYFIEDHRAYLVLDRIHGQTLRQLVNNDGPLPPSQVIELAKQMCGMLIYLHDQEPEIIHRDFTPENLMLDRIGQLNLIDFGVAHELKSRTTATVVGKHAYLPPEQFRGKPSTQSDLYALGATLYFLLLGADPEPLSRLNPQKQLASLDHLSDQEQNILTLLAAAIEQATELDLSKRTASARVLLESLDRGCLIELKSKDIKKDLEEISARTRESGIIQVKKTELANG